MSYSMKNTMSSIEFQCSYQKKYFNQKAFKIQIQIFICFLFSPQPTFNLYWGDSLISTDVNLCLFQFSTGEPPGPSEQSGHLYQCFNHNRFNLNILNLLGYSPQCTGLVVRAMAYTCHWKKKKTRFEILNFIIYRNIFHFTCYSNLTIFMSY